MEIQISAKLTYFCRLILPTSPVQYSKVRSDADFNTKTRTSGKPTADVIRTRNKFFLSIECDEIGTKFVRERRMGSRDMGNSPSITTAVVDFKCPSLLWRDITRNQLDISPGVFFSGAKISRTLGKDICHYPKKSLTSVTFRI